MGRPYIQNRRKRVVEAVASTSRRQAAARFGVGIVTSVRWMAALTTTGTVAGRPQGRARCSKLDPLDAFSRGLIDAKVDIILEGSRSACRGAIARQEHSCAAATREARFVALADRTLSRSVSRDKAYYLAQCGRLSRNAALAARVCARTYR